MSPSRPPQAVDASSGPSQVNLPPSDPPRPPRVRVLHLSDIHCGRPFVDAHMAAAETMAAQAAETAPFDAIVVSGDLSQRARPAEFVQARAILDRLRGYAPTLVVPGNHDTAWWHAPFGYGDAQRLHHNYRTHIAEDLEPTLRVPGVSIVGLNSAAGMLPQAVTWYPRDWRVKGGLTDAQIDSARARLAASPEGDLRVLVVHHNIVRGNLSGRWGLKRPERVLDAIAAAGPHVVCTGHDHEERIEVVHRRSGDFLISAANTLSNRMRGRRPSALNVVERCDRTVSVAAWVYDPGSQRFIEGPMKATLQV